MTATISSTVGGSAGYRSPLLRGGRPALWPGIAAGERLRPVASNEEDIAPSLREQIVDRTALPPQHSRRSRRAATPPRRRDGRPPNRSRSPPQLKLAGRCKPGALLLLERAATATHAWSSCRGEARPGELPVVCRRPPVMPSAQVVDHRAARPHGRRDFCNRGVG